MMPVVSVCCLAYNHQNYIRQCLDSILSQQISFDIEIIINDDASTDGTAEIIREYASRYPDIIKPIYQLENQYSKGVNMLDLVFSNARGEYIAICECDDYWTDSLKLQKQVRFLEAKQEYIMACSDAFIKTNNGELDWTRYKIDTDVPIKDIIMNGGLFIQTASYVFRRALINSYPRCCLKCHVGDYPLIIYASLCGKVRWFAEKQVAYRFAIGNSWTARQTKDIIEHRIRGWRSEIDMLEYLDVYSNYVYHTDFNRRQTQYLYGILRDNQDHLTYVIENFTDILSKFSFRQRLGIFLMKYKLYGSIANFIYRVRHIYA